MKSFKGKRVLITGAAAGIGRELAKLFAKAGAGLVLVDRDAEALEKFANELRGGGAKVNTWKLNVADYEAVESAAKVENTSRGSIDILINNAGIGHSGELASTSLAQWRRLVDVNLFGPLNFIHAFLPFMIERGRGHIVNVASGQAFWRLPTWGAYASVKLALGAISELLHYEVARHNIKVTTVYPFMVNTGFYKGIEPKSFTGRLSMKLVPYCSMKPEKVANIIFRAVERGKNVEMVSPLNSLGKVVRFVPPVAHAVTWVTAKLFAEKK
jgi:short-subunit dehydrogenase